MGRRRDHITTRRALVHARSHNVSTAGSERAAERHAIFACGIRGGDPNRDFGCNAHTCAIAHAVHNPVAHAGRYRNSHSSRHAITHTCALAHAFRHADAYSHLHHRYRDVDAYSHLHHRYADAYSGAHQYACSYSGTYHDCYPGCHCHRHADTVTDPDPDPYHDCCAGCHGITQQHPYGHDHVYAVAPS